MTRLLARINGLAVCKNISRYELTEISAAVLAGAGLPGPAAITAAELLVESQRRGIDSHGVMHLPVYVRALLSGAITADAQPSVPNDDGSTALMDGRNAFGVLVGVAAMTEACRRARHNGVGVCAVRNSNHFGAGAPLVDRAAREGFIALAFSNAAPTMAPWGGRRAVLGTNPIAAAFPRAGGTPIVVDMATSAVSRSRLRQAAQKGEPIPLHWALDASGQATSDPRSALGGTVQPLGGVKGYALTLVVELLCSCLANGRPGFTVRNPHDESSTEPAGTSHLFLALDPSRFGGLVEAQTMAATIAERIENCPPAPNNQPRVPGSRAAAEMVRRDADGIPLTADLIKQLRNAAALINKDAEWPFK